MLLSYIFYHNTKMPVKAVKKVNTSLNQLLGNKALITSNAIRLNSEGTWPLIARLIENMRIILRAFAEEKKKQSHSNDSSPDTKSTYAVHLGSAVLCAGQIDCGNTLTLYCSPTDSQGLGNIEADENLLQKFIKSVGLGKHIAVTDSPAVSTSNMKSRSGAFTGVSILSPPQKQRKAVLSVLNANFASTRIAITNEKTGIFVKIADDAPLALIMELFTTVKEVLAMEDTNIAQKLPLKLSVKNIHEIFPYKVLLVMRPEEFQIPRLVQAYTEQSEIIRVGLSYLLSLLFGESFWDHQNAMHLAFLWISFCLKKFPNIPVIDPKAIESAPCESNAVVYSKIASPVSCKVKKLGMCLLEFYNQCASVDLSEMHMALPTLKTVEARVASSFCTGYTDENPMKLLHAFEALTLSRKVTKTGVLRIKNKVGLDRKSQAPQEWLRKSAWVKYQQGRKKERKAKSKHADNLFP